MWTVEHQKKYMAVVERSLKEKQIFATKLLRDTNMEIPSGIYFLIEDALGEAYRAGAIDALSL